MWEKNFNCQVVSYSKHFIYVVVNDFFFVVDELQGLPPATKKNKLNKAKTPWETKSRSSPPRNKV